MVKAACCGGIKILKEKKMKNLAIVVWLKGHENIKKG
jgi:hypothetical protein